ncbi:MAG: hypothetical protein A3A96_03940 [Candidatus Zambryskibacteria bacterium RIFCSPLOWO2_01_FULL_39_39]|uniref:Uncharacterized protein n=2 Tax=Patescibacteria group TaxID=1783273 RepID=A0A0G0HTX3_9BACT|nr:MAG: hypothetical protein US19_C0049G0006 [Candidatus Daviesbacteria bacterium GW2011_GWB1_36_5]KKQ77743.1 MAG: hypothetical protein UT00_C0006G0045 [Parcubacteria group bacterium GW2011_GWA1_38_7]OHA87098.1 MAG: hypothetical protein A2644_03525 [Candidatus Zambryskibacteria bacterium RIFCSPHIGHO2_01_FULL_39_63]OHA94639.1 MAG: hypothetical protein A3B88_00330 [Candidatus Zambryskibacteria bacterium RIFCSPHIGHO2_02_FULL_39_19]OHA98090.1 MAG: hypothetical protein A3F20_01230 [Candidatus Zambry
MIIITIISILGLSLLVSRVNRFLPFRICPICAGVSLTWIWLVTGYFLGYQIDLLIPALFMGGSVVGISQQLDKKLKIIFISLGFIVAYSILSENWVTLLVFLAIILLILFLFNNKNKKLNSNKELEEKIKNCC